jgi:hypothetical protein
MACKSCHSVVCDCVNASRRQIATTLFPKLLETIKKRIDSCSEKQAVIAEIKNYVDLRKFENSFCDLTICAELRVALEMPTVSFFY